MSKKSVASSKKNIIFDTRDISDYNRAEFEYETLFVEDFMIMEYESDSDGYDDHELYEKANMYGSHLYYIPKPHRSGSDVGTQEGNSFERSAIDSISDYEGGEHG
jgi:hypothetical protein